MSGAAAGRPGPRLDKGMRMQNLGVRRLACSSRRWRNQVRGPEGRAAKSRLQKTTVLATSPTSVQTGQRSSGWLGVLADPASGRTMIDVTFPSGHPTPPKTVACHYSHMVVHTAAVARQLIQIVATDPGLPRYLRREARSLEPLVASKPDLVLDNLEALRKGILPDLALAPPTGDYARCVSVDVFWDYHMDPDRWEYFASDARVYRRYLESTDNPVQVIGGDLRDDEVLIPSPFSWLVPAHQIAALTGVEIRSHLQIDDHPPYIVMILPASKMRTCGVEVREPRGIDAVPSRLVQWSHGAVPNERIDQDIPTAALGGLEWRP